MKKTTGAALILVAAAIAACADAPTAGQRTNGQELDRLKDDEGAAMRFRVTDAAGSTSDRLQALAKQEWDALVCLNGNPTAEACQVAAMNSITSAQSSVTEYRGLCYVLTADRRRASQDASALCQTKLNDLDGVVTKMMEKADRAIPRLHQRLHQPDT